jgi:DNA-binding protein HU-beta
MVLFKKGIKMNKAELVAKLSENKALSELKKSQIEMILNETLSVIKNTVKKDDVTLIGFGTFSKTKRKARMGRNPQTGKELKIPARTVPKFKAGKDFKDLLR